MTAPTLTAIRARLEAATPGSWNTISSLDRIAIYRAPSGGPSEMLGHVNRWPDAAFIAHAPDDVAYLLGELDAAKAENERLRAQVRRTEATTPAPSSAEIRKAIYVLRGLTVHTAGADRFTHALRTATDAAERWADEQEPTL